MTKPTGSSDDRPPGSSDQPTGSSDESIGRPAPWREGRYEKPGKPVGDSVKSGGPAAESHDDISTPVTRKDYEGGQP